MDYGFKYIRCSNYEIVYMSYDKITNKTVTTGFERLEKLPETPFRGITVEVFKRLGVTLGKVYNKECLVFPHTQKEYKIRFIHEKEFVWYPKQPSNFHMFGLSQCTDLNSPVILTEGEFDTMSIYQVGYQACSIGPATDVKRRLKHDLKKLLVYPEIWLAFDNDEEGLKATEIAKSMLPIEKVRLIDFKEFKDANEALQNGKGSLLGMLLTPKDNRPEGFILGSEIDLEKLWEKPSPGLSLPFPKVQAMTGGPSPGEFWLLAGGSGLGKSTVMREIGLKFLQDNLKIFNIFTEQKDNIGPQTYVAMVEGIPIGQLQKNPDLINPEKRAKLSSDMLNTDKLAFTDKRWEGDAQHLLQMIEFAIKIHKFDVILLDHISDVIAASPPGKGGERRDIDEFLQKLQKLVSGTQCCLIAISHLSNPNKGEISWENGRRPELRDLKGSQSLQGKPNVVIGISRNMRKKNESDKVLLEVLKNTWGSVIGEADILCYLTNSGRLLI